MIPRSYSSAQQISEQETQDDTGQTKVITENTYDDGSISIQITQYRAYDTDIYVAEITLSDISDLKTAFANDTYGKNITQTTSDIAESNDAILAINGDYYSARSGYVIRNGVLYRATSAGSDQEDLVIYSDGTFEIITEGDVTAQQLLDQGAWQVLSFGPGLIEDGKIAVTKNEEVDKAQTSNPRTAIGLIDETHYVFVVTDGRTSESEGLSLYELATFMRSLDVQTAYNLDGGGPPTWCSTAVRRQQPSTTGKTFLKGSQRYCLHQVKMSARRLLAPL